MPILTHLNNDQNRINKRINKAALRQASMIMPDVPAPPANSDITINFTALMKSLSNILINLQEVYMSRFQMQFEEDEYDGFDDEGNEGNEGSDDENFGVGPDNRSQASRSARSRASRMSYAPIDGFQMPANPLHNPNRTPPRVNQHIRFPSSSNAPDSSIPGPGQVRPAPSVVSNPLIPPRSNISSLGQTYKPAYLLPGYAPSRVEEILAREERQQNNPFSSLVLNSLTKEIINAKFLAEAIPFSQLTKIQKQNLKQIMVRIGKVMGVIRTGISKPIYVNLQAVLKLIQSGLKSEGDAQEFLLRTQEEMPPEQAGEIEALQGAGLRKHRLLSPALFNAHNVNDNFLYSLSKRNR